MNPPTAQRSIGFPLLALLFASGTGVVLVGMRIAWTGNSRYLFLVWNLFLAWLPLIFATVIHFKHQQGVRRGWKMYLMAALWLLFFPNAPYIFTDLIHLTNRFYTRFWVDLSLILLFAFTGFMLGFMSLYLMQLVVANRFGRWASWLFVTLVAGLGGVGIYLGRVKRWNSWDIIVDPLGIFKDMAQWVIHPQAHRTSIGFTILFATFLFLGYLMLYALTHMQPLQKRELAGQAADC